VTTSPTVLAGGVAAGKSLLAAPVSQQQLTAASAVKTVTVTPQPASQVSTTSTAPILKTVTLTPQQMQAVTAARGLTSAALRDPATLKTSSTNPTATLRMVSHFDWILAVLQGNSHLD
jgi:hypothetical protein